MGNLFKQYFKILGYAFTGLAFGFAFFFLFLNFYHYLEVRRTVYFDAKTDGYIQTLNEKIDTINNNISSFKSSNYNGTLSINEANKVKNYLTGCVATLNNKSLTDVEGKNVISIKDVYNLRESYENDISSQCLINNFIWLTTANEDNYESQFIRDNTGFYKSEISNLIKDTDYIKKELMNNSSYFFNTDISSNSVKNTTRDSFYSVLSSYNKAADFLVNISEWYKNSVTTIRVVENTEVTNND